MKYLDDFGLATSLQYEQFLAALALEYSELGPQLIRNTAQCFSFPLRKRTSITSKRCSCAEELSSRNREDNNFRSDGVGICHAGTTNSGTALIALGDFRDCINALSTVAELILPRKLHRDQRIVELCECVSSDQAGALVRHADGAPGGACVCVELDQAWYLQVNLSPLWRHARAQGARRLKATQWKLEICTDLETFYFVAIFFISPALL